MNKLITILERKDLDEKLHKFKEEHDVLLKKFDEDKEHYNSILAAEREKIREIEQQFEKEEETFYDVLVGKYIVMKNDNNDANIKCAKITSVNSCGPGHDKCHIYGFCLSQYDSGLSISSENPEDRMYPSPIMYDFYDSIEVYTEDEFFELTKKLVDDAYNKFVDMCKNSNKPSQKYDVRYDG